MSESPVGRLAPSPTGLLHLGHARSFLLAWWSVRARGGRMLLRIEDLDRQRCREEYVEACLRDLEWLGLDWDGPVLRQSADLEPYASACDELLRSEHAYPCVCTRAEVAAAAAPHASDAETRYPGTCRGSWSRSEEARSATGREPCLRLRVEAGPTVVHDVLRGDHAFDVAAEVGDFVLRRRDGVFGYQLSVVVDDARQGVTEVLRGADLLPSAARQQLLFGHLGWTTPEWVHVPLVEQIGGKRLAKRSGSRSLSALRESGVDARRIISWAARSAGQLCCERTTAAEVVPGFDLSLIPSQPALLDEHALTGTSSDRRREHE